MAANSILQNVYYHYSLDHPDIASKIDPSFFGSKLLQNAYRLAKDYVEKYRSAPTLEQMKEIVMINNMQEQIQDDLLSILYAQKAMLGSYTEDWLRDQVESWAKLAAIKSTLTNVAAYIKLNEDEAENGAATEIVEHAKAMFNKTCSLDFDDDMSGGGADFWDAESHKQKLMVRSPSGYPFIDMCLKGGLFAGSLTVFAAAPKTGKSLWMCNLCAKSVERGENCCYISLELPEEMVTSRIGSNIFSIDSMEYEKVAEDSVAFKERINQYRKSCLIQPGTLIVKDFPTSQLTPFELQTWLLEKEESLSTEGKPFKFKNVFVDYINIMKSPSKNTDNLYVKIKDIAEQLRAVGKIGGWAIISATQTTRDQQNSTDITTNQISESYGLGSTCDAMFGIIADALMMAQGRYYLKCLYDRVAPYANKKKLFNCDFKYLRITEDETEGVIDTALEVPAITQQKFIKGAANMRNQQSQQQTFTPGAIAPPSTPPDQSVNLLDIPNQTPQPNNFSSPLFNVKGAGLFDSKPNQT